MNPLLEECAFLLFTACAPLLPLACRNLCQTLLCTLAASAIQSAFLGPLFPNSRPHLWKDN